VEGPTDPEVGLATLTGLDGQPVACLLHHTCHPTFGYPHRFVIADWPGNWAEMVRERLGGEALVVNGCCGNIHHGNHLDPDQSSDPAGAHLMAARLTETTLKVRDRLESRPGLPLAWERTVLRLPLRTLSVEEIAEARRYLETYPSPRFLDSERTQVDWDWVYAATRLDLLAKQARDPLCDYEIQTLRLGNLALVALMGEPFVEGQLRLKLASPAPYTFVAHFCNGYAGYIPTAEAFARGGYETRTSSGSKFQRQALAQIVDAALELLRRLFS